MNRKAFWIGLVATVAAIGTHFYLAMIHYQVKFGQGGGNNVICRAGEAFDCNAVAASKYSELFGIPLAVWGILANIVALFFAFMYYFADDLTRRNSRKQLLIVTGFIALTSIVMGGIATALVGKYCLFCMVAYALSFVSFGAFYFAEKRSKPASTSPLHHSRVELKPLIVSAIIVVIAGFIINYGWQKSYNAHNMGPFVNSSVNEWSQAPAVEITPVAPISYGAEAGQAKMTIIEFADYLCPHCKTAGPVLQAFAASRKDVRLIFQTWPLDGECNSKISVATGLRCGLARLSYCAQKLDPSKGWNAVDWIFERQETFKNDRSMLEPTAQQAAKDLSIDEPQLLSCMNSEEAKAAVKQQADLGSSLKIEGTPTIFVNGKKLSGAQFLPILKAAYERL